ncbi:MAG TPA: indolepyruvate ferredoxin oxidoreductase family protein, partial [Pseudomonadales bacterium]|nr:indolepyruvate ferredoxin oxidoreductase family protein [Pseudomonadales bacterium]
SVWGSQQVNLLEGAKYDGVFGIWYGKGPGVDRSGDAMKHGSYSGTSQYGGVLCFAGDDHGAKSSTIAHQSEHAFLHFSMPVLNPATVQDYLDFGLHGFAMSRYSGCWIGFICVTDTVESSASVYVDPSRVQIKIPENGPVAGSLSSAFGVWPMVAEKRQFQQRLVAAQAYVRANGLDKVVLGGQNKKLGIVTTGKAYLDLRDALEELHIDDARAEQLGIAVYKVAMTWPIEPEGLREFAAGCDELLVIEEKRSFMEDQIAKLLFNLPDGKRPVLVGKLDENGAPLVPSEGELDAETVAKIIGARLLKRVQDEQIETYLKPNACGVIAASSATNLVRLPSFCAGCPHNTSTNVPDGSIAMGGIGCHGMAVWLPERRTQALFQMGGEGAPWIGQAPFTNMPHIFQNLGDGTYFHSGLLAIRATVAAKVNITYKILLNGAIAMTGGQPIEGSHLEGEITAPEVVHQVLSEGVKKVVVVSDDIEKHDKSKFPPHTEFRHRDELDTVQRELREMVGTTVIVYDQTCATEKRRLRKRGKYPDPDKRIFINELVCEGCGDCSVQSNCIAIEPNETDFGRKRRINQSSCNKDFSCVKGMCPSFVTVHHGVPRKMKKGSATAAQEADLFAQLPQPTLPALSQPVNILITGIGGTGVVTIGALLGMASHLEGKGISCLDVVGLSQKNGPVTSHIRIGKTPEDLHAVRIATQRADLILGCDIVVTAGMESMSKIQKGRTNLVVNSFVAPTSDFAANPNLDLSSSTMEKAIKQTAGDEHAFVIPAAQLATALFGDAIASNLFQVGFAWQKGFIPLSLDSLMKAIELNGVSVEMNKRTFQWGRMAAHNMEKVLEAARPQMLGNLEVKPKNLQELIAHRVEHLTGYQNAELAAKYKALVEKVAAVEKEKFGSDELARAVATYYSKLLSYKDEYEVARLYTSGEFRKNLEKQFEGDFELEVHLAPPLLSKRDPRTGRYGKKLFGEGMFTAFEWLAKLKFLRGTPFDVFGYFPHRKMERELIKHYEHLVNEVLLPNLNAENFETAVKIAKIPEEIRGYDVVKDAHVHKARVKEQQLLAEFRNPAKKKNATGVQYAEAG